MDIKKPHQRVQILKFWWKLLTVILKGENSGIFDFYDIIDKDSIIFVISVMAEVAVTAVIAVISVTVEAAETAKVSVISIIAVTAKVAKNAISVIVVIAEDDVIAGIVSNSHILEDNTHFPWCPWFSDPNQRS